MLAQLRPADGSKPITIELDVSLVGRSELLCDVVIDHPSVSKVHCVIARTDGLLFFRDLASTNGTRVNGQRAVRGALLPNDMLAFGRQKFEILLGPSQSGTRPGRDEPAGFGDETESLPQSAAPEEEDQGIFTFQEDSSDDIFDEDDLEFLDD